MAHHLNRMVITARFVCLVALLVSCVPVSTPVAVPTSTLVPVPQFTATSAPEQARPAQLHESPQLSKLVEEGSLPPLEERLPENPKVVIPVEEIGQYGGAWRRVIRPSGDEAEFIRTVAYEPLMRWSSDGTGVEPNLAERFEVNENATVFTFVLRSGIRWSDGEPFTTEDIRFWYRDVLLNMDLTPNVPNWLSSYGVPAVFEFLDERTFRVNFISPNSLFLEYLARPEGMELTAFPAHYASKFHKNYLDASALNVLLEVGDYQSWADMFIRRVGVHPLDHANFRDTSRPRLSAWVPKNPYIPQMESFTWVRNPYYWKVDPAGNQLPYLDSVVFNAIESVDDLINHTVSGEIDMQNLASLGAEVYSTLGSREESDRYAFFGLKGSDSNLLVIQFNLTHPDPVMRQIFQNRDFRIALSYAIDRQEIVDRVLQGDGKPWQAAPRENSPFYDPQLATQYTDFNLEKANEHLAQAGFIKDSMGTCLGPDGQPITFTLLGVDDDPQKLAILNMVAGYWAQLGIDVNPKVEPRPLFLATIRSNLHDAVAEPGQGTLFSDIMLSPNDYTPGGDNAYWALEWQYKVRGAGKASVLDAARLSLETYQKVRQSLSREEQARLIREMLTIARDNFWTMGIATGPARYGLIQKGFSNVPKEMIASWTYPDPGPANPEQFFTEVTE